MKNNFWHEMIAGFAIWVGTGAMCYFLMWLSYYI